MSALDNTMGLREDNKREKLRRIEAAARRLFSQDGYNETSTRAIAREAGIGVGTLFVYFPEKRDLLNHLFCNELERVEAAARESLPPVAVGLVERLMHVFGAFYDYYEKERGLARIFAKELLFTDGQQMTRAIEFSGAFYGMLAGLIDDARGAGELGDHFVSLQAAVIVFSVYYMGLVFWLGGHVDRDALDVNLRTSLELFVQGLRPK